MSDDYKGPRRKFSVRTRYVWFTLADWQAFSDALVQAYPQARYDIRLTHDIGQERPEVIWDRSIVDVPLSRKRYPDWAGQTSMIFHPDWQPERTSFRLNGDPPDTVRWSFEQNPPLPFVKFSQNAAPDANELASLTLLEHNDIHYFYLADSKPAAAEMRKFIRLLDKFCTNRNQALYRLHYFQPGFSEYIRTTAKGSDFWLGHDAIRWAYENPSRMMHYLHNTGIRPVTEEEMAQRNASLPSPQSEEGP